MIAQVISCACTVHPNEATTLAAIQYAQFRYAEEESISRSLCCPASNQINENALINDREAVYVSNWIVKRYHYSNTPINERYINDYNNLIRHVMGGIRGKL
jgi:hypothetical protein